MSNKHNNPPFITLELDEETTDFIEKNCDKNIQVGLNVLMNLGSSDRDMLTAQKVVDLNENFKKVKALIKAAKEKQ